MGLDALDELSAVQAGHDQVGEDQVDAAALEDLQGLAAVDGGVSVAAGLEHDLADGERLLVVVHAEDDLLRLHRSSPTRAPLGEGGEFSQATRAASYGAAGRV